MEKVTETDSSEVRDSDTVKEDNLNNETNLPEGQISPSSLLMEEDPLPEPSGVFSTIDIPNITENSDNNNGPASHSAGISESPLDPPLEISPERKQSVEEAGSQCSAANTSSLDAGEPEPSVQEELREGNEEARPQENALPSYVCETEPLLITGAWDEFKFDECYTKGCKWSPDGTCILTNSEDNVLRIFDLPRELHCQETWARGRQLPDMKPSLRLKEGGCIYDYCWYPFMSSWNPLSCCLLSTSYNCPIHLWDAYTGELRCSYRAYNSVDEVEHAYSVAFSVSGDKLYCGFKNVLRVFDTNNPGRDCCSRNLKGLGRAVGIVSGISVNPAREDVYAICSYLRTIVLCVEPQGEVLCLLVNEGGGLTYMTFSPDGTRLYAGCRNDSQLFCWDMRNLGTVLFTTERTVNTHQRIYFDLTPDGRYLVSGGTSGIVSVWDTQAAPKPTAGTPFLPTCATFKANDDCVNGISLHKQYPILATSSGQRHFCDPYLDSDSDSEDDVEEDKPAKRENSLKLWWMGAGSNEEISQNR